MLNDILNSINVNISLMEYKDGTYYLKFLNKNIISWYNKMGLLIELKDLEGKSYIEVADILRLSEKNKDLVLELLENSRIKKEKSNSTIELDFEDQIVYLQTTIIPVKEKNDFIYISYDITDKIEDQIKIDSMQKQLSLAQVLAGVGSWELDLKNNRIKLSEEYCKIIDLDQEKYFDISVNQFIEEFIAFSELEDFEKRFENAKNAELNSISTYTWKLKKHDQDFAYLKTTSMKFSEDLVRGVSIDITDHIQKQKEIEENNSYAEALLNSLDLGFWAVDKKYNLRFFNVNYFNNLKSNFNTELQVGNSVFKMDSSLIFPVNDKVNYDKAINGEWFTIESYISNRSGLKQWGNFYFSPLFIEDKIDGALVVVANIDERKKNESELLDAKNKLELISSNGNDIIAILNKKALIEFVSLSTKKIIGYDYTELQGKSPLELIHPDDKKYVLKEFFEGQKDTKNDKVIEFRFKHKDGHYIWFETIANIDKDKDGKINILTISRDVSNRIEQEKELIRQKEIAQKANLFKTKLIESINHELRTPINGILGIQHVLNDSDMNEETKKLIKMQMVTTNELLHNINSMILFSEIETNKITHQVKSFDLIGLTKKLITDLEDNFKAKELILQLETKIGSLIIQNDPNLLRNIFDELSFNSMRYTNEGGLIIKIEEGDSSVIVSFIDSGVGFNEKSLLRINESLDHTKKEDPLLYESIGIGLFVCKKLSLLCNVDFRVNSTFQKGTEIILTIKNENQI